MTAPSDAGELEELLAFLTESRNFDFTAYKRPTLRRRIERRMHLVGVDDFPAYRDYLTRHPGEFEQLFNTVLINVTTFFRDTVPWDFMTSDIVPRVLASKGDDDPIRVWSAGCATGEEAFTLAMVLAEVMGVEQFKARVKIYATDLDDDALHTARQGMFSAKDVASLPAPLLDKYFEKVDGRFCFRKDLRRIVIFGRHDLLRDAPISRVDILVCRNTVMYFNTAAQARILARFHFALNETGYLFLGRAETLLSHAETFRPVDLKRRVFAKIPAVKLAPQLQMVDENTSGSLLQAPPVDEELREGAFDRNAAGQLVVDTAGILVSANQMARTMFSIPPRSIGTLFHDLEISYKPVELRSLIQQAYREERTVFLTAVEFPDDPEARWFEVRVVPVPGKSGEIRGASISFNDVTANRRLQKALELSALQLGAAYEQMQSTNEELETTNEELQSAVEELETTNEELQATNEELETMNEELQSTNDELQTVNDLARAYTAELDSANDFLESVFTGLGHRVIVLDDEMRVILWNKGAEELWGLRSKEVEKTKFFELDIGLPVDALTEAIQSNLEGNSNGDRLTLRATNRRGQAIDCRVTIAPLSTGNGEGVRGVILLTDATPIDGAEERQRVALVT